MSAYLPTRLKAPSLLDDLNNGLNELNCSIVLFLLLEMRRVKRLVLQAVSNVAIKSIIGSLFLYLVKEKLKFLYNV